MIDLRENAKWTVYAHISPSNKIYIGITSQDVEKRWKHGNGYKSCYCFYRAIQKYGWDNFQHEIIASNLTESEAKDLEESLIQALDTINPEHGYNLLLGEKIANKDQNRSNFNPTPVCQFDLEMNLLNEYPSIKDAFEKTGASQGSIYNCCNGVYGSITSGGYVWIYKKDINNIDKEKYLEKIKKRAMSRPVCQFDLSMNYLNEYPSVMQAGKQISSTPSPIYNAASGSVQQAHGFIWIFKEDYLKMLSGEIPMKRPYSGFQQKRVYQFTKDLEFVAEYLNTREAAEKMGVIHRTIADACNGRQKSSCGFIWRYEDDAQELLKK